jgi:hypothetical protein
MQPVEKLEQQPAMTPEMHPKHGLRIEWGDLKISAEGWGVVAAALFAVALIAYAWKTLA